MKVDIQKVFDSRGMPTIMAYTYYEDERIFAIAPAGKSTGMHEAQVYPLDKKGKANIDLSFKFFKTNEKAIFEAFEFDNQEEFDSLLEDLDETNNFSDMGANLSTALSMLFLKVQAKKNNFELYKYLNPKVKLKDLPKPLGNVVGGGLHSNNKISIQEFLVLNEEKKISENILKNINVYHEIENILKSKKKFFGKNDEGAISFDSNSFEVLNIIEQSIKNLGYKTKIGLDIAASSFYKNKKYEFEGKKYSESEYLQILLDTIKNYKNIYYIEDPFDEESFTAFAELQKKTKSLICGDDLFTTNKDRLIQGIKNKSAKAILIKPNQIGTITKTIETVNYAKKHNVMPVISHRSGESIDNTISHLAVGLSIPYIKTGTVSGERLAKLNELIFIEKRIEEK